MELAAALARILTGGGPGSRAGAVPEACLLELEREVFVELCAQPGDPRAHPPHARDRQAAAQLTLRNAP